MTKVKIQKIPMKNLSPKELAELAFDMGVTRGGSGTANTPKGAGMKRGAYGKGSGMEKGGKVEKPKTLPKPKPKIGDRNEMGPIYTDTKTGKKVKRLNKGGGLNAAIDRVKKTQGMKEGGAAFPDLTGDGKVTQKDILKGRGVDFKQEGGAVRGMGRAYMGAPKIVKIR